MCFHNGEQGKDPGPTLLKANATAHSLADVPQTLQQLQQPPGPPAPAHGGSTFPVQHLARSLQPTRSPEAAPSTAHPKGSHPPDPGLHGPGVPGVPGNSRSGAHVFGEADGLGCGQDVFCISKKARAVNVSPRTRTALERGGGAGRKQLKGFLKGLVGFLRFNTGHWRSHMYS